MGQPIFKFKTQLRNRSVFRVNFTRENLCGALHPRFSLPLLRQGRAAAVSESLEFLGAAAFIFLACLQRTL